jgi:GR25 family glycosyltransferase involved in LPS biosynthesis
MINENIEKAMILEDDIMKFENDFEVYLKEISMIDNDKFHIVWLNYPSSNKGLSSTYTYITPNIYRKKNTEPNRFSGTYGYVITLQGAKHLINYIENNYKNASIYGLDRFISYAYANLDQYYTSEQLIHTPVWNVANKIHSDDISNTDIQINSDRIINIDVYMKNIIQLIK